MANDLDFSHSVRQIPAQESLPAPIKSQTRAEQFAVPDYQGAAKEYAQATNVLTPIGSYVAAQASNALAKKLGSDLGQKPQGDLGLPLTEFDATMQKSYNTQAQQTLGLQANKLITESNIEMAKSPRITPDLIAKTNRSVTIGLQNIFKHAPAEVQGDLAYHYGNVQLEQAQALNNRMVREQREDQKDLIMSSSEKNAENAYSLALSGNYKAASAIADSTKKANESGVATRAINPHQAKINHDTVRQSGLTGKYVHDYEEKRAEGKGEEFLKSLADKKPSDLTDSDYMAVTNNLMQYVNHQNNLRVQDENLRVAQMTNDIARNVTAITPAQLEDLRENVSPIKYEETVHKYIQARKAWEQDEGNINQLIQDWGSGEAHARASEKNQKKAFDLLTGNAMEQAQKSGHALSHDEAEVQVALSAGAPVKVFTNGLNNKLTSGNPAQIESAMSQIQSLRDVEGGHALIGLSKQAEAIATQYAHRKGSMPDPDLAREVTDNILNITKDVQQNLDNSWNLKLKAGGAGGPGATKSLHSFALKEVGLSPDEVGSETMAVLYGNDIYQQLRSNFDVTRGDYDTAKKMTQAYVDQNYGDTRFNGGRMIMDHPIEKALGYKDYGVVPYIQQDMLGQMGAKFEEHKNENEYWTTSPVNIPKGFQARTTLERYILPLRSFAMSRQPKGCRNSAIPSCS